MALSSHFYGDFTIIIIVLSGNYVFNVEAKYVSGHLITHKNWAFMDRFCFLSIDGSFEYQIEFQYDPENMGNISLLMYPDLLWPRAYKNPKADTCEKKQSILSLRENQIVPLRIGSPGSGCEAVNHPRLENKDNLNHNGSSNETSSNSYFTHVLCKNLRKFRSARERWWFIVIASCDSTTGLDVKYRFYMKNGERGDYWYEQFSADEFYILPILTAFCFIYLFLLFTSLIFAVELKCRQLLHTTYKLFLLSLALQCFGIINLCLAYGNYAGNGVGLPNIKLTGQVLEGGSEFIFVLLLLLLAKGYTVTRGRLRPASAVKLTIFNCMYALLYSLLLLFEQYTFDPGEILYIYESEAGYGILILRLVGYLMFVYGIFFTLKHYPEKSSFYFPFFGIYSLWFISGPIVILITNHVIDKWVREKVAVSIQHMIAFIGHVVFLGLTRPSAANKSFPYHVRTSQVGDGSVGHGKQDYNQNGILDGFQHGSYAPSAPSYDLFTVPMGNGYHQGMDVFSVSGGLQPSSGSEEQMVPAVFPAARPKYDDAFPHEKPGQVEEMLKEEEEESGDDEISGSYRPAQDKNGSPQSPARSLSTTPPILGPGPSRERKYICDDNQA